MAELIFDTSSEDEELEGFTPDDVIKAIQKRSELRRLNEDELSDISFDDLAENECENDDCDSESNDGEDEIWKDTLSAIQTPAFTQRTGPTTVMNAEKNELDFVSLIFIPEILSILVAQTNLYAMQLQQKLGRQDKQWTATTVDEIRAYLGIRIFMSVLQLPAMEMYWSTDYMFGNLFVPNIMPTDRFNKLCQYFHANDSTTNPGQGEPGHDRLHHVRPLIDIVNERCLKQYNPHQNTSIDEAMIAFRGRLGFRQYLPAKPTKYGIKVWMRADSENGYCNEFEIYTGKSGDHGNAKLGLTTRVVLNLTKKNQEQKPYCQH